MCAYVCEQMQVLSHNCTNCTYVHACVQQHNTTALQKSSTQTGNLRRSVVLPPRGLICSLRRQPFFYLAFQIVSAQLLVTNLALVFAHNRFSSLLVRLIFFARTVIHKNASLRSLSSLTLHLFSQISKSPPAAPGSWQGYVCFS